MVQVKDDLMAEDEHNWTGLLWDFIELSLSLNIWPIFLLQLSINNGENVSSWLQLITYLILSDF